MKTLEALTKDEKKRDLLLFVFPSINPTIEISLKIKRNINNKIASTPIPPSCTLTAAVVIVVVAVVLVIVVIIFFISRVYWIKY